MSQLRIEAFDPVHRAEFARLNLAWLERWFEVEPIDREVLTQPEVHILAPGGAVFFAHLDGAGVVGTCALKVEPGGLYELTKMAVEPQWQGQRIGQQLLRAAIRHFVECGGRELFLESSSKLPRALQLYRQNGFELQPGVRPGSHYARSDIYMIWRPALDPLAGAGPEALTHG